MRHQTEKNGPSHHGAASNDVTGRSEVRQGAETWARLTSVRLDLSATSTVHRRCRFCGRHAVSHSDRSLISTLDTQQHAFARSRRRNRRAIVKYPPESRRLKKRLLATTLPMLGAPRDGRGREVHTWQIAPGVVSRHSHAQQDTERPAVSRPLQLYRLSRRLGESSPPWRPVRTRGARAHAGIAG